MPDHTVEIAELEELLKHGVTSSNVDGNSESIDLDQVRSRLNELKRANDATRRKRPVVSTMNFNNF